MNKQDLIKHLASHAEVTNKQAESLLNALTTTVLDTVRAGGELVITDLGKFGTAQRAAKRVPTFTAAKKLKDYAAN